MKFNEGLVGTGSMLYTDDITTPMHTGSSASQEPNLIGLQTKFKQENKSQKCSE
jgi:hypothetical protein